jgi:hypothetical protein
MARHRDPLEPKVYLPSKSHPDYQNQEWEYFAEHYGRKLCKKGPLKLGLGDPKVLASHYLAKVNSDEKDRYVIEAVKLFGDHLLELTVSLNPFRFSDEAERLGAAVCRVLGGLRRQALAGNYDERREAKTRLEKIVKGILPDTRGKKRRTAHPSRVRKFYWSELFRLYHIQHALRSPSAPRNQSQRVVTASTNFEMPIQQIREFWGLDKDDQPTARPISIREMARILTDRHFGITQHRLSNILAS